jgi:hypothetical protein
VPVSMLSGSSKTCSIYEDLSEGDYNVKPFSVSTGWFRWAAIAQSV